MEYTSENVERAVIQFYAESGFFQPEIHQWLSEAGSSPQAWSFVWDLLRHDKPDSVKFFGASTLKIKIEKALNELNLEQMLALKGQLLTTLVSYCNGSKMVQSKLCSCLSVYMLQTCTEIWQNALPEIMSIFTPVNIPQIPADVSLSVLLELLIALPRELSTIYLAQNKRSFSRHYLVENNMTVFNFLEKILSTHSDHEIIEQSLKCVSCWMDIGLQLNECQNMTDILIRLIFNTFQVYSKICEGSLDALCRLVSQPDADKHPESLLTLLIKILPLQELIARELTNSEPDQDVINDLYGLFVAFGETHARLCLYWIKQGGFPKVEVMNLINCLLQCSGARGSFPMEETHSRLAFGFWYMLQDEMTNCNSDDCLLFMKLLSPVYKELVDILIMKAKHPDPKLKATQEDLEAFRCYRQDIGDTLICCYTILHVGTISLIKSRFEQIKIDESSWQELEACLFSLSAVAGNVFVGEELFLPNIFRFIGNLPFQSLNPKVLATALDTIGAYAEWISSYSATLEHVLPPIALGLTVPQAAPNATMALKDLTKDCQQSMKQYAPYLLGSSQEALHSGRLKINESMRLMFSVGRILSVLSSDQIMQYLDLILSPYLDRLNTLSLQQPTQEVKTDIVLCLKLIGTLNANLDIRTDSNIEGSNLPSQVQPVLLILQKILPVIKVITYSWSSDSEVMQGVFSALKLAVKTLLDDTQHIVTDILDLLITSYKVHPHPLALDLAKQLCVLFGKSDKYRIMMQSLTNELCTVTMATVSSSSNISEHRELLENLFVFLGHILKKVPKLFLCVDSVMLFQCAIACLSLPEFLTVKSASAFITNVTYSEEMGLLENIVNVYGEQLLTKIVSCIAGEASRSNVEVYGDILLALNRRCSDKLLVWLRKTITERTCGKATLHQREQFIKLVLKEKQNKKRLQDIVKEFSSVCRGCVMYDASHLSHFGLLI